MIKFISNITFIWAERVKLHIRYNLKLISKNFAYSFDVIARYWPV
jgi:hypothetical protein